MFVKRVNRLSMGSNDQAHVPFERHGVSASTAGLSQSSVRSLGIQEIKDCKESRQALGSLHILHRSSEQQLRGSRESQNNWFKKRCSPPSLRRPSRKRPRGCSGSGLWIRKCEVFTLGELF